MNKNGTYDTTSSVEAGGSDKPIGVVEDSPQPERELFDLMIFDNQESREQGYDPMTGVSEKSDGLIEPNGERRADKPVVAVEDSSQSEKEPFELLIPIQKGESPGYDPMTGVSEKSDGLIEPDGERRKDKPVEVVEDSPQPEKEPFELMIFDNQEIGGQSSSSKTGVPEKSDGLKTGTVIKSAESLNASGTTDALAEPAIPVEQDNARFVPNIVGSLIKSPEDECKIDLADLAKGLSLPLEEGNSLIPLQQVPSRTGRRQLREQDVEVTNAVSTKPTAYDTALKMASRVSLLTIGKKLYFHNGAYYVPMPAEDAHRLIVDICREDVEAVGSPNFVKAVYDMLLKLPELEQRGLEANQHVVSFQNGALLLDTGELVPNSPKFFTTYGLQCNYLGGNPACPRFDQFLMDVTGGDRLLIERIWQMMGYILSPDTKGKVLFVLQGVSNSGKSVLSELLCSFFNTEAVLSMDANELGTRFGTSNIEGKALCISPDMSSKPLGNDPVGRLKQLSGNDLVSSDVKNVDRVQFRGTAKIVMVTNNWLGPQNRDVAFENRIIAIPFNHPAPEEHKDRFLIDKLKAERDAIATKAMNAYYRLVAQQYRFCGDYKLNECAGLYSSDNPGGYDVPSCVWGFLKSSFIKDEGSEVFIRDAHEVFAERYGFIQLNTFSSHFVRLANQLYGATQTRKRKLKGANPTSCVEGIRFIGEGGQI